MEWGPPFTAEKVRLYRVHLKMHKGTQAPFTDILYHPDIYRSRLGAWDEVEFRKHILYQVYSMGPRGVDLLVLGKLESTLKNGRSFEMEFAAQVIFADATSDRPEAISYKVWAVSIKSALLTALTWWQDKRVAIEAAKGE